MTIATRGKDQLGSDQLARARIREELASGRLKNGRRVHLKMLVPGDDLNWSSIFHTLDGYQGARLRRPDTIGLPGPVPHHLLTWNKRVDDLVVTFLDEDVATMAYVIRLNVQDGLKDGSLRSGEHAVASLTQGMTPSQTEAAD